VEREKATSVHGATVAMRNIFELQIRRLSFGWEIVTGSKLIVTQRFDSIRLLTRLLRCGADSTIGKLGQRDINSPCGCTLENLGSPATHQPPATSSVRSTTKRYLSESPKAIDSDNDDVSSLSFRYSKRGPLIN
jgi:hypothetical protein